MPEKPHVHVTDMMRFVKCRLLWHYASPLRNNLVPVKLNKHLVLGEAIHAALAAYYVSFDADAGRQAYAKVCGDISEEITDYVTLGWEMLEHYFLWAPARDAQWEVLAIEKKLHKDYGAFVHDGIADLIVRVGDDFWIVEHKTYSRPPSATVLGFSLQPASYVCAAREELGVPVKGVIYNILRKKAPTTPKMLKSGRLEMRKNVGCTPEWYRKTVRDRGLDPTMYEDFIATLDPNKLNVRYAIEVTPRREGAFLHHFTAIATEMIGKPTIYPADPMRNCDWCGYRSLCERALYGLDWRDCVGTECIVREDADYMESEEN